MLREQAINYLRSSGMSEEQINGVVDGLTCEDVVSREAVLKAFEELPHEYKTKEQRARTGGIAACQVIVRELPPVTPKQRMGKYEWVQYDYNPKLGNWHCSECRCIVVECVEKNRKDGIPRYKYCPHCGAKMEGDNK